MNPSAEMLAPPAGVLCDMDGLLLDTERLAREAFGLACSELSLVPDEAVYQRCIGSTHEQTERLLTETYGEQVPYHLLEASWSRHYHDRLATGSLPVKAGVRELLETLTQARVAAVVVTSTRRALATWKLEAVGLLPRFAGLVCGGEATPGKPHPTPYQAGARLLDLPTSACWALEDSDNGVRAALAAGCTVFQVPDLVPAEPLGQHVVASLHDVHRHLLRVLNS